MNYKSIIIIFSLIIASSCQQKKAYFNTNKMEHLDMKFTRFEREFNGLKKGDIEEQKQALSKRYPIFYTVYNQGVIRIGAAEDERYNFYTKKFLSDSIYLEVYDTVMVHFPDMKAYEKAFSTAFSRYHAAFPHHQIPAIYTHISGFNEPIVVADSTLSISLENYLGPEHVFYKRLGTYTYQLKHKNEKHLVGDAMRGWLASEWDIAAQSTLLDHMIHEGKILFILEQIVPDAKIEDLIGISTEQYEWCERYTSENWAFMIEKKHLFSNRNSVISKYIQDGPFFNFVGAGSSPMIGKHIGWKIVSSYMQNHPQMSLEELLKNKDSQSILEKSKFKP